MDETQQHMAAIRDADTVFLTDDTPYKEEQPSAATFLQKGDLVHARLELPPKNGVETEPLHTEFVVSGINGSRVYGSAHFHEGMSQHDGWRFELVRREQQLPDTVSEIVARMRSTDMDVTLMGKGTTWINTVTGASVDPADIVSFTISS